MTVGAALGSGGLLGGCSPALDWREVNFPDAGLVALFPCKPDRFERPVALPDGMVRMSLASCAADGTTFALSHVPLDDPARITPTIERLRDAARDNVVGRAEPVSEMVVAGMTPNPQARRWAIDGRRPDGTPVREEVAFFVKGLRVFQATVVGERVAPTTADAFFGGLRLP